MATSEFQVRGYFYIHNRMPSSVFNTLEDAEDSANYIINQSTRGVTFYSATKITESKLKIKYIQHWNPKD